MKNSASTPSTERITENAKPEGVTLLERLVGLMCAGLGCVAFSYLGGNIGTALGTSLLTMGFLLISGKFKVQSKDQATS
jgi:hypothetical protein